MKKLNQHGAVAIISVILFSIIISILAMAYARTIIVQQRQSINYDLSARAYYAAEAGVQDAIRELREIGPGNTSSPVLTNGQNTCKNGSSYLGSQDGVLGDSSGSLAYTCQLVDPSPSKLTGSTTSDSALWQIKPAQTSPSGYIVKINWSNPAISDQALVAREDGTKLMPPVESWNSNGDTYHPLLRASFISAPANATRSDYGQEVYFLNPTSQAQTTINVNPQAGIQQNAGSVTNNAKCESGNNGGYQCSQSFDVPKSLVDAGSLYLVIHSVYAKTNYEITLAEKTTNKELGFKNSVITIDVTAKAGDVFRRVKQQVPISGGYKESWFDASGLVVGDGICKLFSVGTVANQYSSECKNPIATP